MKKLYAFAVLVLLFLAACTPEPTPTSTPEPGPTDTPIVSTDTPEPTDTPTSEPTDTPDRPREHDVTVWHPIAEGHHHGADPSTAHPLIVEFLEEHPEFASIGHPWTTSDIENVFPYPGKHEGFVNLVENDTGCQTTVRGGSDGPCVEAFYLQVHTMGTGHALRTRFHSDKIVAVVRLPNSDELGVIATGGHVDYGILHSQYKETICPDPTNPNFPDQYKFQPPYRTVNLSNRSAFLWSSNVNALARSFLDPDPNNRLQLVWSERPWTVPGSGVNCIDPASDVVTGHERTQFQVFSIHLEVEDLPRPFNGFTDIHGNISPGCAAPGPNCVPLYVGENVPADQDFDLLRSVDIGDANDAPILDFSGEGLVIPGGH